MLLKKLAAAGDQRAYRSMMELGRRFGPPDDDKPVGYLIVPEPCATTEEWQALYGPKDGPPPNVEE